MWWIALAGVVAAGASWGLTVSNVEQPKYKVIETVGKIEMRDYAPMIVAQAEVAGEREKAVGEGFRIIADYIFGNNLSSQKVSMTAPVTQQISEKIAMTAPVTQQSQGNSWTVRFIMPAGYTMETLPKPRNPAIKIMMIEGKHFAAIRFSGLASEDSLNRHTDELMEFIRTKTLTAVSAPAYAFYNPPWTLPFLRRNEVMIEIAN